MGSIPVRERSFPLLDTRTDRPWGPPSLLQNVLFSFVTTLLYAVAIFSMRVTCSVHLVPLNFTDLLTFGEEFFLNLCTERLFTDSDDTRCCINPLNPELNPICCLLALLAHHFLHVSGIRVKSLTLRLLMSHIYIYVYIWSTYS